MASRLTNQCLQRRIVEQVQALHHEQRLAAFGVIRSGAMGLHHGDDFVIDVRPGCPQLDIGTRCPACIGQHGAIRKGTHQALADGELFQSPRFGFVPLSRGDLRGVCSCIVVLFLIRRTARRHADHQAQSDPPSIHVFDKRLRLLVLDAVERIKVKLRVDVFYLLGAKDPFAHTNPDLLRGNFAKKINSSSGRTRHQVWLDRYQAVVSRLREHLENFPIVPRLSLADTGFPADWQHESLWQIK